MRVITGSARGHKLETLPGEEMVRPTSEMSKEAMFSALHFYLPGAAVLDLFAGSGQLGIEALSRGARRCTFVDLDREAAAVIRRNLKKTGLDTLGAVMTADALSFLRGTRERWDLVFADPPYRKDIATQLLPLLQTALAPGGYAFLETEHTCTLPEESGMLVLKKCYKHGRTRLWLYHHPAEPVDFEEA